LDAKVKTAISSIPEDAWTTIECTDAVNDEQSSCFPLDVTSAARPVSPWR
jgi:hypothetical protein